jgi:hypothetical protein
MRHLPSAGVREVCALVLVLGICKVQAVFLLLWSIPASARLEPVMSITWTSDNLRRRKPRCYTASKHVTPIVGPSVSEPDEEADIKRSPREAGNYF